MLGTQLYYEFLDDSPTTLQRSLAQLKKELESKGVPRNGEARLVPTVPLKIAVAEAVFADEVPQGLDVMSVEQVCAWCMQHQISDSVIAAVRAHALSGPAVRQLLRCSDLNTIAFATALASALAIPTLGPVLAFIATLQLSFA